MRDLNNTWCEATEENYKALLPLVYTQNINLSQLGKGSFYIKSDNTAYFSFNTDTPNIKYKQIHLVNGEFQFVETKPKNNFKDYGFEADFEGEILKQIDDMYIGYYLNKKDCPISCTWWSDGLCSVGTDLEDYILKPIKKEWYENPDNIGKFISINNTLKIFKSYAKENETIIYISLVDNLEYIIHISKCRPATKEEVLSLLIKED